MQRRKSTESMTGQPIEDAGCRINIRIGSQGDVNIYNCSAPPPKLGDQPCPPRPPEECPAPPIAPGQCVPLTLGAKPKQSQQSKLDRLLENNRVPSALAASFFHLSRRFLAGRAPGSPLEESVFDEVLRPLSPELRGILSCAVDSFDALPPGERDRLFDATLPRDPDVPLDASTLATAVAQELTRRVGVRVFDNPEGVEEERPGQNRFYDPGSSEVFDVQLRICRVNGLRTNEFAPALNPGDYQPAELQQRCTPVLVNGEVQLNCQVQKDDCPGHFLSDGSCLRVPEVRAGEAVLVEGVNFISVDTTVRLAAQSPGGVTREVEAHVVGDRDTPLNEVVDGETRTIRDCRVRDRLTFRVPDDLPEGIYSFQLAVPNVSGIPSLGDPIVSNPQYLCVVPPPTARFQIAGETLTARQETSPASFGSDEVRVRVMAVPFTIGPTEIIEGEPQVYKSPEYGDMDSGDTRSMNAVLFSHQAPLDGVVLAIWGHEIDSAKAYRKEIDTLSEAFLHYLKIALAAISAGAAAAALGLGLKDLVLLGLANWWIVVIGALVVAAFTFFLACWAPADPIIEDNLGFTTLDLAALTGAEFPAPAETEYPMTQGIQVKVFPLEKTATEYRERREYISHKEESRYEIVLRYNRVA